MSKTPKSASDSNWTLGFPSVSYYLRVSPIVNTQTSVFHGLGFITMTIHCVPCCICSGCSPSRGIKMNSTHPSGYPQVSCLHQNGSTLKRNFSEFFNLLASSHFNQLNQKFLLGINLFWKKKKPKTKTLYTGSYITTKCCIKLITLEHIWSFNITQNGLDIRDLGIIHSV